MQGSGFTTTPGDTLIQFLPQFTVNANTPFQNCAQSRVTPNTILCQLPQLSAGAYTVQVQVLSRGVNAAVASSVSTITTGLQITSVWPTFSSTAGGQLLFVSGSASTLR